MPHGLAAGTWLQGKTRGGVRARLGRPPPSRAKGGLDVSGGRSVGTAGRSGTLRYPGAVGTFYLGLLALLLIEQFIVRVPPKGYLDVAMLFAVANVVLALQRARDGLRTHGTLRSAVLGVLPVAIVGTAVGATIVAAADSEPTTVAVVGGSLLFMVLFVTATAGWQYLHTRSIEALDDED